VDDGGEAVFQRKALERDFRRVDQFGETGSRWKALRAGADRCGLRQSVMMIRI